MAMQTMLAAVFAVSSYVYFFWSLPVAATAFMINLSSTYPALAAVAPYNIDHNERLSDDLNVRLLVNVVLLGLFAIPHSILARPAVKKVLGMPGVYRSMYTFQSSFFLHMLLKFWQPIDDTKLWGLTGIPANVCLFGYMAGWAWLVTSTFALDHMELFGLKDGLQIDVMGMFGFGLKDDQLAERAHYSFCRHPIMLGFFIMFFAVPAMTYTHLFFSAACTAYILLAVSLLEEPDLIALHPEYNDYKARVPMYCPFLKFGGSAKQVKAA